MNFEEFLKTYFFNIVGLFNIRKNMKTRNSLYTRRSELGIN